MTLHIFSSQEEKDWVNRVEDIGSSIIKLGRCEINVTSKIPVGFQTTTLDSWIHNTSDLRKPQNTLDSRKVVSLAPDRFESSFYQPLPSSTIPNAQIVPSWYLQPIIDQIEADFVAHPELRSSVVDYRRWWGFYREESTFTVKWPFDKKVLLADGDETNPERSFWISIGSYEKSEFRVKHYVTGRRFDRNNYFDVVILEFNVLPPEFNTWADYKLALESRYPKDIVTQPEPELIRIKLGNRMDSIDLHNYYLVSTGSDRYADPETLEALDQDPVTQVGYIPVVANPNPTTQTPTSYPWWEYGTGSVDAPWNATVVPAPNLPAGYAEPISYRVEYCNTLEFAPSQTDIGRSITFESRRLDTRASGQTIEVMASAKMIINLPVLRVPFLDWDNPTGFGYGEFGEIEFGN